MCINAVQDISLINSAYSLLKYGTSKPTNLSCRLANTI